MPRENKSKYAILGLLSLGPKSGYDIKKRIAETISNFWHESNGQIYPILKQLVAERLATKSVEEQIGKPDRYVYTLTDKGREQLQYWLTKPVEMQVDRIELLLKLFFGHQVDVTDNILHVEQFRAMLQELLQKYSAIEEEVKIQHANHPKSPYWLITVSYKLHVTQALIHWCDETLIALSRISNDSPDIYSTGTGTSSQESTVRN